MSVRRIYVPISLDFGTKSHYDNGIPANIVGLYRSLANTYACYNTNQMER